MPLECTNVLWFDLDPKVYPTGVKISNAAMAQLHVTPHEVHPQWNYTLQPRSPICKK